MSTEKLPEEMIKTLLGTLTDWSLNDQGEITRNFKLKNFSKALLFVNAVGHLAETADHHPDILIRYNQVTLSLSTHSAGGLTRKDFDLAGKIDSLAI